MTHVVRASRGVWLPAAAVSDLRIRVSAILPVCPSGSVVAGITAARLHGLWLPPAASPDDHERVEIVVHPETRRPSARPGARRHAVRARRRVLRPSEVTVMNGVLVTTAARTWFDLCDRLPVADLVALGDCVLRADATMDDLVEIVEQSRRCPGVVRAREALPLLDGRSRSRPESHLRYALVSRGLPKPAVNVAIHDATGGWIAEPDLSYDDVRLAIEYNGRDHAELTRMRRDLTRGVDVLRSGWRTLAVGPAEVFRRPDELAAVVRHLRAAPRLTPLCR